jgi:hypothetical protein
MDDAKVCKTCQHLRVYQFSRKVKVCKNIFVTKLAEKELLITRKESMIFGCNQWEEIKC